MDTNITESGLAGRPQLVELRRQLLNAFDGIADSHLLLDYPLHVEDDGNLLTIDALALSPNIGLWIIFSQREAEKLTKFSERRSNVFGNVYAKLVRSALLRKGRTSLKIDIQEIVFDPVSKFKADNDDAVVCRTAPDFRALIGSEDNAEKVLINEALRLFAKAIF